MAPSTEMVVAVPQNEKHENTYSHQHFKSNSSSADVEVEVI